MKNYYFELNKIIKIIIFAGRTKIRYKKIYYFLLINKTIKTLMSIRAINPLISPGFEFEDSIEDLISEVNAGEEGFRFPFDFESCEIKEAFEEIFIPPDFSVQNDEEFSHGTINQDKIMKNRGRPRLINLNKTTHGNKDFDNLQRKVQVHFLSFLIHFCNDALRTEYGNTLLSFKQINKKSKITIKYEYTKILKNSSIKDILNLEISTKYSTYNKLENQNLLSKIEVKWLNKLFQMNYLELFKLYYNEEKPLNKIVYENHEIILSTKTKSFYFLLEKYKTLRQNLIEVTKIVYLNDFDEISFQTKNISLVEESFK